MNKIPPICGQFYILTSLVIEQLPGHGYLAEQEEQLKETNSCLTQKIKKNN